VEWWKLVWHKHVIPDFLLFYGLLFMKLSLLKMSLGPMVLFRLFDAFYVGVIGKMLITYFLTAHSLITFGMIYALDASFLFGVALGLALFLGSLI
jgi:hypothetical protein